VWTLALLLLGLALAVSWPAAESAAPAAVQASVAKPAEKPASSSMLAKSGYSMALAKDKLD
jgi:hypothetical protein